MKRNLFITGIVVSAFAGILILSQKGSVIKKSIDNPTQDFSQTQNLPVINNVNNDPNAELSIANLVASQKVFKADNPEFGTIGVISGTEVDNPKDNEFHITIDQEISTNKQAYLEYDLYGVQDFTSVCKGVNDNVSMGGLLARVSNTWSNQSEQIPASQLRKGDNIIRFSVPENCDYGYKVKNIKIRFEDEEDNFRRLVINQPTTHYYYKKYGYINGFVTGKGSENAKIYANGKPIRIYRSMFEGKIEKNQDTLESWQTEITAVFEDGQKLSTIVDFERPSLCDYTGEYSTKIPYSEIEVSQTSGIKLNLAGFKLEGEEGSIKNKTKLSVTGVRAEDMSMIGSSMVNVTGENKGYRCLPHGSKFDKDLKIHVKYDTASIPKGYSPKDIRTYYYDEASQEWVMLKLDTIDIANNEVTSYTNHFTDFINAVLKTPEAPLTQAFTPTSMKDIKFADPMAGFNVINPPSANNYGSANMSFPIEIPAGRQGMQPQLAISYNSEGGNGWLGLGWGLNVPSISVDTRWGVPHYFPDKESESYLMSDEELLPQVQRSDFAPRTNDTIKIFTPKVEGAFNKIKRHGTTTKDYWWEVIDKQGVRYFYGKYSTEQGVNQNCVLTDATGNIAHWALAEVRDLNGNYVKYNYTVVTHNTSPGNGGKQIYLSNITYTGFGTTDGKYMVEFMLDDGTRTDYSISGRYGFLDVTDRLLRQIKVTYNNNFVRSYVVLYKDGAYNKKLICTIADIVDSSRVSNILTQNCETNFRDYSGCKFHQFSYYNETNQEFSEMQTITTENDDGTISLFNNLFTLPSEASLGKSISYGTSIGGSLDIGFGKDYSTKKNSVGGNYTYFDSKSKENMMFADINGDGLPDRLYKHNGGIYFRKLKFVGNQLVYDSQPSPVQGLQNLGKSGSYGHTWGLEGQVSFIGASYSHTKTTNITSAYFSDVNADGYVDYIDDGNVYYNYPDSNGNPQFFLESNTEIQYIGGDTCNFIIRSGEVNDSVYTPTIDKDLENTYTRDAVRMWIAPYAGTVRVLNSVRLIEDTSYSRRQSLNVDGVHYSVQYNTSIKKKEKINRSDYNTHTWDSTITLVKGDRIYFRLRSFENRSFDKVLWNPTIYYTAIDTNTVDADGKKVSLFTPSNDVLVNNKQTFQAPYTGKVRIRGTMTSSELSDSIFFKVKKGNIIYKDTTFDDNTVINYSINDSLSVTEGDSITFNAFTNTNIDWNKINYNFKIYYYRADSVIIDTNSIYSRIEVRPMMKYNLYQDTKQRTYPYIVASRSRTITPVITANSSANGTLLLAVKINHKVLAKKTITIQNGIVLGNPSIVLTPPGGNLWFEYYSNDLNLSNNITSAKVNISMMLNNPYNAGLHSIMPDTLWKFGNLYRGWGQFSYNDNSDTVTTNPISENKLYLNRLYRDSTLITFDTTNISDPASALEELSTPNNLNDPFKESFNMMFPDLDSMVWRDYARYSYVGKHIVSNVNSKATTSDTIYDSPLVISSGPNHPIRVVRKSTEEINNAYSITANIGNGGAVNGSLGIAYNTTTTNGIQDYFDLNGDRFPDIIGSEYVQYTTPQGGIFDNVTHSLNGIMACSESNGSGMSFGVNLPVGKSTNLVSLSTIGSGMFSVPIKLEINTKQSSIGGGANVYQGHSNASFSLIDVNGDGLPDKVYKTNGEIALNKGYSFGSEEDWNLLNISRDASVSFAINVGGGQNFSQTLWHILDKKPYNKREYSWSGGVSISTSGNDRGWAMADMNNDGYIDLVYLNSSNDSLSIYLNTGHGFGNSSNWSNYSALDSSCSTNASANISGSFGFPVFIGVKVVVNLHAGVSGSANLEKLMLSDFNNDGNPDIVSVNDSNKITVRFSQLGKINLLKQVTTPTRSKYIVDYILSTCDQKMPQRRWNMTSLKVYDGFHGDGQDTTYHKFEYANGNYDRFERAFLGYETVTTKEYNTFYGGSSSCYRSTIEKYHNENFLFKGLKYYEGIFGGTTVKFLETYYKYDRKEKTTGSVVPANQIQCFGPYYPAISREDKYYYEGNSNYSIHTKINYTHGKYGNISEYYDRGDTIITTDDVRATITYDYDTTKNLVAMVHDISVYDINNNLLRERKGGYNTKGQITEIGASDGSSFANTNIDYDSYGNIQLLKLPKSSKNQRMSYAYMYDNVVHTYPITITDTLGFTTQTTYDYRLGAPLTVTDITGNQMVYTYYQDGKPKTVLSPYENGTAVPYTISFDYWDNHIIGQTDSIIWAQTLHYDPNNINNHFVSVSFVDGLGRAIQAKQKATIMGADSMIVSGRSYFDAYGRVTRTSLPTTEALGTENKFKYFTPTVFDSTRYDTLDRKLFYRAPDQTQVSYSYDFGQDAFFKERFKTVTTDPNNKVTTSYTGPSGKNTSVTDALNGKTQFAYNALGELIESKDPEENRTRYTYDMLGRMTQRDHPDAGITSYTYDLAGNLLTSQSHILAQNSQFINYDYYYNQLNSVTYPQNPENNAYYRYGDYNSGNQAGKIIQMQDASGTQEFSYGKMGELTQNIHTFVVPNGKMYTYQMNWQYDSWNRVKSIIYADGEEVSYGYNNGGQLIHMSGDKNSDQYSYISDINYNRYGSRKNIEYGNGAHSEYIYNPLNQRLTNLKAYESNNTLIQNINYTYDNASNITAISNAAGFATNNTGGNYSYSYTYDNLYRLTSSGGSFSSRSNGTLTFDLDMGYSASGNITSKEVSANTLINGSVQNISYSNSYDYNDRPHTVTKTGSTNYEWDLNGNMIHKANNDGERHLCWDEENRLTTVLDIENEQVSDLTSYLYNAAGDRTWKLTGEEQVMWINGQTSINVVDFGKTLYASPYMVINEKEYTKHYYIEGERVCSKIGSGFGLVSDPTGYQIPVIEGELDKIPKDLWAMALRGVKCTEYNADNVMIEPTLKPAENMETGYEEYQYFYHSDHLGSSSFITDASGYAEQHLQYLPFGETFVDQNDGKYDTPYKFSGKEKDDETGLSYFGARYYDSDLSVWLSVDPLASKYPSTSAYMYCLGNPVMLIDPNGESSTTPYWEDKISGKIVWTSFNGEPKKNKGDWKYLGETITRTDNNGNTKYHDQYGKSHTSVPLREAEAKDFYSDRLSAVLCRDDKGYGPPRAVPANGSIEVGVSGAGGYGAGISISLAWDDKGGGAFQVNLEESGGFEVPNFNLTLNSYTPLKKSFSVKDMSGPTSKTSGGVFMFNYGSGENSNYNGINGNIYKVNSFGLSIGAKSLIPASVKQSLVHTFQFTWQN
jgi:RHS repeat-associated protein